VSRWGTVLRLLRLARRHRDRPPPCRNRPWRELRLESDLDEVQFLFNKLYAVGVDYDDVVATLEREGIEKFVASFNQLLKRVGDKRRDLAAAA